MTRRPWVAQAASVSRRRIVASASASEGRHRRRISEKKSSRARLAPSGSGVVSQCHAASKSGAVFRSACRWSPKTSSARRASSSGSFIRPRWSRPVLVVLDQVMIGIAGKGEGAEPQRIQRREFQQPQVRLRRGQMGQVEGNQVVAQNERRPVGEIVQRRQRRRQAAAGIHQGLAGVRAYRAKLVDALVFPADLEIQRETGGQENPVFLRCRQRLAVPSHDCLAFGPAWALSAKTWRRPPRSCSGRTVPVRMSSLVDFVGHKETITID